MYDEQTKKEVSGQYVNNAKDGGERYRGCKQVPVRHVDESNIAVGVCQESE